MKFSPFLGEDLVEVSSKRPPAERVAFNSPHSGGLKVGTSVPYSLGSRTIPNRRDGLKINNKSENHFATSVHQFLRIISTKASTALRSPLCPSQNIAFLRIETLGWVLLI